MRDSDSDIINSEKELIQLSIKAKEIFYQLVIKIFNGYTNDVKFSSVRFFETEFKGVHIEAEIPRNL